MKIYEVITEAPRMPSSTKTDDSPYQTAGRSSTADKQLGVAAKYRAATGQNIKGSELVRLIGKDKYSAGAGGGGDGVDPEDQRLQTALKQHAKDNPSMSKREIEDFIKQQQGRSADDVRRDIRRDGERGYGLGDVEMARRQGARDAQMRQDGRKSYRKDSLGRTLRNQRYYGGKDAPNKPVADRAVDGIANAMRKISLDPELYGQELSQRLSNFGKQSF